MNKAGVLQNTIQEYAWGSKTALAEFLGRPSHIKKPMAELWMGAHPKAPSQVIIDGNSTSLIELISNDPKKTLGDTTANQFNNTLPYLFKVLAADQPLSIQAHPTIGQAEAGFDREDKESISIDAPNRNYKDKNHKPEIICALSTFWALNGFRNIDDIITTLTSIKSPQLHEFSKTFIENPNDNGIKSFLLKLFALDSDTLTAIIKETLEYARFHVNHDPLYEWMLKFNNLYPGDVGILTSILLNMICLQPGEAMFLQPGQLHAYLNGFGIELMANSDNVIRGGLTTKHIDANELISILDFNESPVNILKPESVSSTEKVYRTPAQEFQLSVINVSQGNQYLSTKNRSIEIIICSLGFADLINDADESILQLSKGDSVVIPASIEQYKIEGNANLYKSSVPLIRG